jgi:hypothetical protein
MPKLRRIIFLLFQNILKKEKKMIYLKGGDILILLFISEINVIPSIMIIIYNH